MFVCPLLVFVTSIGQYVTCGLVFGDHQHFQRRRAALPRGPVQERLRAQKLLRRFAAFDPGFTFPVTGAFKLLPVERV